MRTFSPLRLRRLPRTGNRIVPGGRGAVVLGSCLALGLSVLSAILAQEAAPNRRASAGGPNDQRAPVGVSSCAAYACHGGNRGEGDDRSAYTTWMALDPHSRAESVLRDPRSIAIETRLASSADQSVVRADADPRCLGCHVSPTWPQTTSTGVPASHASRREGVGCEACHGPASRWLAPHSTAEWRALAPAQKAEYGMTPTTDPAALITLCVGCHVGGPGRDVDHDLIAAGHPRLDFEALSYLDALPKHWDETKRRRDRPDLDAQIWAVGQAASAREALGLLSLRAHAAQERQAHKPVGNSPLGVWPEFAEYACTACHHPLTALSLSLSTERPSGSPLVTLPWGDWYYALVPSLSPEPAPANEPLDRLRRLMESNDPQPTDVERLAQEAQAQLARLLGPAKARLDRRENLHRLARLVAAGPDSPPSSWERAAQRYLGVAALTKTLDRLGSPLPPGLTEALDDLKAGLVPPSDSDSPGRWTAEPFAKALDRFRRELARLTADLEPPPSAP